MPTKVQLVLDRDRLGRPVKTVTVWINGENASGVGGYAETNADAALAAAYYKQNKYGHEAKATIKRCDKPVKKMYWSWSVKYE